MNNDLLSLAWDYVGNELNYELIEEMSDWYVKFSRLKNTPLQLRRKTNSPLVIRKWNLLGGK